MQGTLNLIYRNEQFIAQMEQSEPGYFDGLSQGQSPNCFVLACSDSRVSPSVVTQAPLGYLFVHRNVANQVVEGDASLAAGLYYALKHLKVKKVIVTGHTGCGGIAAVMSGTEEPVLQPWLCHLEEGLRPHLEQEPELSLDELSRRNIRIQVERLKAHPVYQAYGQGVPVEGYLLHLACGRLELVTAPEEEHIVEEDRHEQQNHDGGL